jgi:hypothetical protein
VLAAFAVLALILYLLSVLLSLPSEAHTLVQADWADDSKTTLCLCSEVTSYRENRSQKPYVFQPQTYIYESLLPPHEASIDELQVICEGATFYGRPLHDGFSRVARNPDGRLVVEPANESAKGYFKVPPGMRYTIHSKATTYTYELGYAPLVITTPILSLTVELCGNALDDLWISVLHPGLGSFDTDISGCGAALAGRGPIRIGDVGVMGQAILLYWARYRPAVAAPATAALPEASVARPESELCHRLAAGQADEAGGSQGGV